MSESLALRPFQIVFRQPQACSAPAATADERVMHSGYATPETIERIMSDFMRGLDRQPVGIYEYSLNGQGSPMRTLALRFADVLYIR